MYRAELYLQKESEYETVYGKYYSSLVFFAQRYVDPEEAEDIVTEQFIKLWHKRADFTAEYKIKAFLYISARNACLNYVQSEQYHGRCKQEIRYLFDSDEEYIEERMILAEVWREIAHFVNRLPAQCRKIIILHYSAGLKPQEIAELMHISKHTVRNQIARGIDLITRRLQYEHGEFFH